MIRRGVRIRAPNKPVQGKKEAVGAFLPEKEGNQKERTQGYKDGSVAGQRLDTQV